MPRQFGWIIALSITLASQATAVSPKDLFDELFGEQARSVAASRDRADDIALAQKLMQTVETLEEEQAAVKVYLLDKAFDLTSREATAYALSIEIAQSISELDPKREKVSEQRVLSTLRLAYARARGKDRTTVGRLYIDHLVNFGESAEATEQWPSATSYYQQALTVAAQNKLTTAETLKNRLTRLRLLTQTQKRLTLLRSRLLRDATDHVAAHELALLYITTMNAPDKAIPFAKRANDETLAKNILTAVQPLETWDASTCFTMAQWYEAIAKEAPLFTRDELLIKSLRAYERFVAMHKNKIRSESNRRCGSRN